MLTPKTLLNSTVALAAAGLLAGCAGSTPSNSLVGGQPSIGGPAASLVRPSWISPDAKRKKGLIYVADYTNSEVHIYPEKGTDQKEIGSIAGLPILEYLNVDRWHNLYAVEFVAGEVVVFPRGSTQSSLTLTVNPSGSFPNAVAISKTGEVAVGQFQQNGVNFYKKGSPTPYNLVPPVTGYSSGFCAYDKRGNLYVIESTASGPSHIAEIVGGGKGTRTKDLGVNTGITNAKGIQVDTDGNIAVVGDSATLNLYKPGSNTLISTNTLNGNPEPNGGFSLLKNGKSLYVASAILDGNLGQALKYAYPAGGNVVNTITVEPPPSGTGETAVTGVAVDPPEQP
ncbi:MAG TPA: hypothetical protein VIX83_02665 [Candidatus Cybelea sp.]